MSLVTVKRFRQMLLVTMTIATAISPVSALDLSTEFVIELKESDRVLGELEGNFLLYRKPDITMYNVRGNKLFTKKLKNNVRPVVSPNGKYVALVTFADHSPTDLKTASFEMYDQAGRQQWKMSQPAPNEFMIADNGAIFGIEGVKGIPPTRIHLYDQYGNLRNILTLKEYHGISISSSGGKLVIDRAAAGLDVYDSLGNLLVTLPAATDNVIDRDDRYIGTFFQGKFCLYQDEKEVKTIKSSEISLRDLALNVKQNLLLLMAPKRLEVFELTTGRLLWEYRLLESGEWFTRVDLSDDGRLIACGVDINRGSEVPKDQRHVEGYVYLFPISGQSMYKHKETYKIWGADMPRAVLSPTGGSFMLLTQERLQKFKLAP